MGKSTLAHLCNMRQYVQEIETFPENKVIAKKHSVKNITQTLVVSQEGQV